MTQSTEGQGQPLYRIHRALDHLDKSIEQLITSIANQKMAIDSMRSRMIEENLSLKKELESTKQVINGLVSKIDEMKLQSLTTHIIV